MNTGGPAFPHGPLGDSIQHEDGRISHQWQGSAGMDLLDWMAGQALAAMVEAESKESHKQLTKDGYEHEATHFPRGFADEDYWDGAAKASYACAAAMLAEKARREADHSEDKLGKVDHSPDSGKMAALEAANRELVEALEKFLEAGVGFSTHPVVQHDAVVMALAALAKAKGVA